MGYHRAGFEVVGVDIEDRSAVYPFEFHQAEALAFLAEHGHEFDVVHASPNCRGNIAITKANRTRPGWSDNHVNDIPAFRAAFARLSVPTVIENGVSNALRHDVVLCGLMFGLPTLRHRAFELDRAYVDAPEHPGPRSHPDHRTIGWRHGCIRTAEPSVCPKHGRWCRGSVYGVYGKGGYKPTVAEAQRALGVDWTDDIWLLNEAIPPAYTEFLGRELIKQTRQEV